MSCPPRPDLYLSCAAAHASAKVGSWRRIQAHVARGPGEACTPAWTGTSCRVPGPIVAVGAREPAPAAPPPGTATQRSEEHTSELQSRLHLVCRLLLEKKK